MSEYDETANALEYKRNNLQGIAGKNLNAYRIDLREKLVLQLKEVKDKATELEELISLLDKNPDIQRIMDLMGLR